MTCRGGVDKSLRRSSADRRTVCGRELGMVNSSIWMPLGVYLGCTSASNSVLEPGGAYPASELSLSNAMLAWRTTHVNHFALKYDQHQAL